MARLTYKNGYGKTCFLVVGREITGNAAEKLAQYEDLGEPSELQRIKRAEWKSFSDPLIPDLTCYCSNCLWKNERMTNICPDCGAYMRSDEERTAANDG